MVSNKKLIYGILVVAVLAIGGIGLLVLNRLPTTPTLTQEVTITTDKLEYEQGEPIKITVENKKSKPIYCYFNSGIPIEKFENGKWNLIFAVCSDPCSCDDNRLVCRQVMPPEYFYEEFETPFVYLWDQTVCIYEKVNCGNDSYSEGILKPLNVGGKFKAKFCYWDKEDINFTSHSRDTNADPDKEKCIEKEFIIK